jgi:hypothetical protein
MDIASAKSLPMSASVDVLVCGGGTAGAVASIAAARAGANTLVVEQFGALGGTQSQGWVTPMMPNKMLEESLTHGISDDILRRAAKYDPPPTDKSGDLLWYNPVTLALVLDELLAEAGGRALFNTWISEPVMDGATLVGVVIDNKAGRRMIRAKIVIDCTGDADVAFRSGAPCVSGGEEGSGRRQPATLRFTLGNVDQNAAAKHLVDELGMECYARPPLFEIWAGDAKATPLGSLIVRAIERGEIEEADLGYLQFFSMLGRPRELAFNCPRIFDIDPNDPWSVSRGYEIGRKAIQRIAAFFRQNVRGFEDSYISVIAPMLGIRESRRIVGEYVLTAEDYVAEARFPDAIARNSYPMDIHTPSGTELIHMPRGHFHEIPYRCMVPLKIDNLLVAGRCVSATFAAQAAIRIQQNCRAMGEAAGLAAAMCADTGVVPRRLDTAELRRKLNELGASI